MNFSARRSRTLLVHRLEQHSGVLFCTVPFTMHYPARYLTSVSPFDLAYVFELFNQKKKEKAIESYSITQSSLEQIFVRLTAEDQNVNTK